MTFHEMTPPTAKPTVPGTASLEISLCAQLRATFRSPENEIE